MVGRRSALSRPIFRDRSPLPALALVAALGAACSGPTTPTPPPPPPPDPLSVTCPAPVSQASPTGLPVTVHYGAATAVGGTPPVQIACTPTNDSTFPIGSTTVTCSGV